MKRDIKSLNINFNIKLRKKCVGKTTYSEPSTSLKGMALITAPVVRTERPTSVSRPLNVTWGHRKKETDSNLEHLLALLLVFSKASGNTASRYRNPIRK